MLNRWILLKFSILIGLISGLLLGLSFKIVEKLTGVKVYTLLLNLDFIPGFSSGTPEFIEFSLHLTVSILIAVIFTLAVQRYGSPYLWAFILGIAAAFLYIPLSLLSQQGPSLTDSTAIIYWLMGHLLYSISLGVLGQILLKSP